MRGGKCKKLRKTISHEITVWNVKFYLYFYCRTFDEEILRTFICIKFEQRIL